MYSQLPVCVKTHQVVLLAAVIREKRWHGFIYANYMPQLMGCVRSCEEECSSFADMIRGALALQQFCTVSALLSVMHVLHEASDKTRMTFLDEGIR